MNTRLPSLKWNRRDWRKSVLALCCEHTLINAGLSSEQWREHQGFLRVAYRRLSSRLWRSLEELCGAAMKAPGVLLQDAYFGYTHKPCDQARIILQKDS